MITVSSLENLDALIELVPDIAFFKNINFEYIYVNKRYLNFIKKNKEDVLNKTVFDLYSIENACQFDSDDKKILQSNKDSSYEEPFIKENGEKRFFYTTKQIVYDQNGNKLGLFCIVKDVTIEVEYEIIYKDSRDILEYIAIHENLTKTLDEIVRLAEHRINGTKCSILLLDKKSECLFNASSNSLPNFFNEAIDGIKIGEKVGSCGSAAFKQERVIVDNIDTHENWQAYLELTQKANLHACWSEPIFSSEDELLGTFAIYHDKVKLPSSFSLKLINSYAHLAAVAIEKDQNKKAILKKEHQLIEQIKQYNVELKSQEDELSKIFNNALVGLMYITGDRKLIKGNQRLADIFGYESPQEMLGISMHSLHLSKERFVEFGRINFQSLKYNEKFNIEYQLRKKDGSSIWCELSGRALDNEYPADLYKGVLWTVSDISARKTLENKVQERTKEIEAKNISLKELSIKDHLTGLYNRSKLDEVLEYNIKYYKRYKNSFGLILIDIDHFKSVNDTYGHQAGDIILKEFSNIILTCSRETDVVGRWGGEEFLIIVDNITQNNIVELSKKIRNKIENHKFSILKKMTASLGCTIFKENDNANEIIFRVDEALYKSKNNGRNCIRFL